MKVRVSKLISAVPVDKGYLKAFIKTLVQSEEASEGLLELFINIDKDGKFVASIAHVGEATTEEVKAALDEGQVPKIFGCVAEPLIDEPVKPALEVVPDEKKETGV